jgi:hypothetical protein
VLLGKMGEMRAGGPCIPCKVSRSKEGCKCRTESRLDVDPFFVVVDFADHPEENVVTEGRSSGGRRRNHGLCRSGLKGYSG